MPRPKYSFSTFKCFTCFEFAPSWRSCLVHFCNIIFLDHVKRYSNINSFLINQLTLIVTQNVTRLYEGRLTDDVFEVEIV